MMKPKAETEHDEGMLEYLEDIIGSSRFKEPIEQLAKDVDELSEARKEKVGSQFSMIKYAFYAAFCESTCHNLLK